MSSERIEHRSRRAFRLRTPLTLMLLLALLIGASWYAVRQLKAPPQLSPPGHCTPARVKVDPRGAAAVLHINQVRVTVFNAPGGRVGLAAATSSTLQNRGFQTGAAGNDRAEFAGVANVRAADPRLPSVALVMGQVPGATFEKVAKSDPSVDLVLGPRFRGLAAKYPGAVPVTTRSALFPADCTLPSITGS